MRKSIKPNTAKSWYGALQVMFGGLGLGKAILVTVFILTLGVATNAISGILMAGFDLRSLSVFLISILVLFLGIAAVQKYLRNCLEADLEITFAQDGFKAPVIVQALSDISPDVLEKVNFLAKNKSFEEFAEASQFMFYQERLAFRWLVNLVGIERHLSGENKQVTVILIMSSLSCKHFDDFRNLIKHFFGDAVELKSPADVLGDTHFNICDFDSFQSTFETVRSLQSYFLQSASEQPLLIDITSGNKMYSSAVSILSSGEQQTYLQYIDGSKLFSESLSLPKLNSKRAVTIFNSHFESAFVSRD